MEIEINSAERPFLAAFAQNDRDLFVEGNAMAHSRSAIFVSGDGLVQKRFERRGKIFRRLADANDVFLVGFERRSDFFFERLNSHRDKLKKIQQIGNEILLFARIITRLRVAADNVSNNKIITLLAADFQFAHFQAAAINK